VTWSRESLEDEREQDDSRRQAKKVFQARVGRRSRTSCGAEVATRGVLPSYTYSGLDRTVNLSNAPDHLRSAVRCSGLVRVRLLRLLVIISVLCVFDVTGGAYRHVTPAGSSDVLWSLVPVRTEAGLMLNLS